MSKTKVKICGISNIDALKELIELNIDFIGFIFHQNSPRNVDSSFIKQIPQIDFKNSQQKKFYYIKRAIMMGNIFIAMAVILYLSKEFLGV